MVEDRASAPVDLSNRTLYIPQMSATSARTFAAAFRSVGIDARPSPDSDQRTLTLGLKYTSGDECYPQHVTLGNMLKVVEEPGFEPTRTAFFMPTSEGPCRFGQYSPYLKQLLEELGKDGVAIVSPTSANSYDGMGERGQEFMRTGWRALVAADALRKMLLRTRPYERNAGETDRVLEESIVELCAVIEKAHPDHGSRLKAMVDALSNARDRYRAIPADYTTARPLVGVVGEIFCRLNRFSNDDLIRKLEEHGAECWLSDLTEWVWYTNSEARRNLKLEGRRWSGDMLKAMLKEHVQRKDEEALLGPFEEDFKGLEEPHEITEILEHSEPYLPNGKVLGEMVINVGRSVYLHRKGGDGIVDISPFTCMNGIASEAVYPAVSEDCGGMPIRSFYFDGTTHDLDRDLGIFVELARSYKARKQHERAYPACFSR